MTCISDHAKVLLIYYKVVLRKTDEWDKYNYEEVEELYTDLKSAEERAESFAEESEYFVDVEEVRIIQDDKRIYTMSYYLEHF